MRFRMLMQFIREGLTVLAILRRYLTSFDEKLRIEIKKNVQISHSTLINFNIFSSQKLSLLLKKYHSLKLKADLMVIL